MKLTPRQIDALVAEKVMGLPIECVTRNYVVDFATQKCEYGPDYLVNGATGPYYSTDIAAAWEVLSKFSNYIIQHDLDKFKLSIYNDDHVSWSTVPRWAEAAADTAPMAITLASLKAVGVEVE